MVYHNADYNDEKKFPFAVNVIVIILSLVIVIS